MHRNYTFLQLPMAWALLPTHLTHMVPLQSCGRTPWRGVCSIGGGIPAARICTITGQPHMGSHTHYLCDAQQLGSQQARDLSLTIVSYSSKQYYGTYYSDHYSSATCQPHWATTAVMIMLVCVLQWLGVEGHGFQQAPLAPAPRALTQQHGTYVHKKMYEHLCTSTVDTNVIRNQPATAKSAHGLTIITMNVTSWNSKVYRYVASLSHDVIFIQEHRKTLPGQIRVPKGYKMIFSPAQVTGSKAGGTLNTSGGVAILVSTKLHTHTQIQSPHAVRGIQLGGGYYHIGWGVPYEPRYQLY